MPWTASRPPRARGYLARLIVSTGLAAQDPECLALGRNVEVGPITTETNLGRRRSPAFRCSTAVVEQLTAKGTRKRSLTASRPRSPTTRPVTRFSGDANNHRIDDDPWGRCYRYVYGGNGDEMARQGP